MLSTVKGIYKNGQVILEETPETGEPVEVLVTFTKNVMPAKTGETNKRVFGVGKGLVLYMSPDFNEPLDEMKDYM